ncbi:unnamed protein product [Camellia sinensis]
MLQNKGDMGNDPYSSIYERKPPRPLLPCYLEALETLKVASESDVRLRQVNPDFSFEHANKDEIDDCNAISTDIESVIDGRLILDFLRSKNFVAVDYLLSCMMDKNTRLDSRIISTAIKVNSAQCY